MFLKVVDDVGVILVELELHGELVGVIEGLVGLRSGKIRRFRSGGAGGAIHLKVTDDAGAVLNSGGIRGELVDLFEVVLARIRRQPPVPPRDSSGPGSRGGGARDPRPV